MVDGVVEELVGLGCKVKAVLGEFVVNLGELAPVGSLISARDVLIRNNTDVDLLDGVFELIHEHIGVGLVDGLLLVLVNAHQGESDSLDVEVVDHRMSEEIVGIEDH